MLENRSDEELVSLAKSGNESAFEELFRRHKKPILNFIFRMVGNRETAEEVCVEVFMQAYRNLDIFDIERRFTTWLYTIAKNLAKNSLRDRKYFRDLSLDQSLRLEDGDVSLGDVIADKRSVTDEPLISAELEREAEKALDLMPAKLKEVMILCSIQGLTYREAAEVIGCSIASISARMEDAKELFMKKLGIIDDGKGQGR